MKTALTFNDVSYLHTALAVLDGVFPAVAFDVVTDGHGVSLVLDLVDVEIEELKAEVAAVNNNIFTHVLTDEDATVLDAAYAPIIILGDETSQQSGCGSAPANDDGGFLVWISKQNFAGRTLVEQSGSKGSQPLSVRQFEPA